MWIRLRLDIGWGDLVRGFFYCLKPGGRSKAVERARHAWSEQADVLIPLSVRSGFDLLLRALQLPPGSEVLLSALTVPDMVRIVEIHGLIPVPVDTDENGQIIVTSLRHAMTPQTRMVVVAHLFGGCVVLDDVLEIARQHNLMVVEDCAQSFHRVGDSAHRASDVAMFSFGPIKTATALGGAVIRVSSPELRASMAELLNADPIQSRASFARRLVRFTALKFLSGRLAGTLFRWFVECLGYDFDSLANSVVKGFGASDLMTQLRRQPSTPLMRLLRRRWQSYNFTRIERRIRMGRRLDARIGQSHAESYSYWVYPVYVREPVTVRDRFRSAGFDATCRARMTVVPAVDESRVPASARFIWEHVMFLPWYPEMPDEVVDKMASLIGPADLIAAQQYNPTPAKSSSVVAGLRPSHECDRRSPE